MPATTAPAETDAASRSSAASTGPGAGGTTARQYGGPDGGRADGCPLVSDRSAPAATGTSVRPASRSTSVTHPARCPPGSSTVVTPVSSTSGRASR
jgi:hypothetical protein